MERRFSCSQLLNFLAQRLGRAARFPKRHALFLVRLFLRCTFAPRQNVFYCPVSRSRVRSPAREEEQLALDARQLFFFFSENIFVQGEVFVLRLLQLANRRSHDPPRIAQR